MVKAEVQSIHQLQQKTVNVPISNEAHRWPDAKQELLDKFFRSHSSDRRSSGNNFSKIGPTSSNDPVAEIYARLPPLDPSVVASVWKEEVVEETDELSSGLSCRPV